VHTLVICCRRRCLRMSDCLDLMDGAVRDVIQWIACWLTTGAPSHVQDATTGPDARYRVP
jgi:hypothetical protein